MPALFLGDADLKWARRMLYIISYAASFGLPALGHLALLRR
jgi:hypothetical protein